MISTVPDEIRENLTRVRERVDSAALRAGRKPDSVALLAVTKTIDAERVTTVIRAGVHNVGENYIQEARGKIPAVMEMLAGEPEIKPTWHNIGHLQSNKARFAAELFDCIQGVDSLSLAQEIGRRALKLQKSPSILLEVNLAPHISERGGVLPEEVIDLAQRIDEIEGIQLAGLMAIAPPDTAGEDARPHFRRLYTLWEKLPAKNRVVLSMGMSADFEVAIEEGGTMVRIGTALFGRRKV